MAKKITASAERLDRIGQYVTKLRELYNKSYYAEEGLVYIKVSRGDTVHTFIDKRNGNILKAASYKAPAPNGVRGSIYMDDLGMHMVNEYGAEYLK